MYKYAYLNLQILGLNRVVQTTCYKNMNTKSMLKLIFIFLTVLIL